MLNKVIIIAVLVNIFNVKLGVGQISCPPCEQSSVCISSIKQEDCEDYEILDPKGWCNCCPGCVSGLALGKTCDNNNVLLPKCAPGLSCLYHQCALDKDSCLYLYHFEKDFKWMPICTQDGKFPAKLCKGDRMSGRCFCLNEKGERIFGYDWWKDADNMECACSRHRYKLESEGRSDVTLHCAQNGNYEPLQCDSGVCWCANEITGQILPNTTAVPDGLWTFLPCYNETIMGTKYLRQCESASYAQGVMRKVLSSRGTLDVAFNNIVCDYDGSHGIFFIKDGIAACQWRDGSRIGSYQVPSNQVSQMNCNCARDQKVFAEIDLTFQLSCSGNGNYYLLQNTNGNTFCVDRDGYAVTDYNEVIEETECSKHYYYIQ